MGAVSGKKTTSNFVSHFGIMQLDSYLLERGDRVFFSRRLS